MDGVRNMGKAIGLPADDTTIQVLIHKDNVGALFLTEALPPQFNSQQALPYNDNFVFRKDCEVWGQVAQDFYY